MGRRRASQPRQLTAEQQERRDEIARLKRNGAAVTLDRGGRIVSAYRSNVFNLLLTRNAISQNHYNAAHRLCEEWAIWKGMDGAGERTSERVDGGSSSGAKTLVTDRMIRAGRQVKEWLVSLDDISHQILLTALIVATVEEDRPMVWRGIVERATGETVRDRQTQLVKDALESLRQVIEGARTQEVVAA